jgi:gamma-glutamylcyclotransferase (GGCT)/AIG2-like uncharacterized protein YtfP
MEHTIFAYGTLNRERTRAMLNVPFELVGDAVLPNYIRHPYGRVEHAGQYEDSIQAISYMEGHAVEGKLWKVDDKGLERVDGYESVHSGMYERVKLTALVDGEPVDCYAYCQGKYRR